MLSGGYYDIGISVWADHRKYAKEGNCILEERLFDSHVLTTEISN